MPNWKASALAEFRVTVLGTSAHWTVDLKLYLETFEGYTNRVVQIFGAGWFAVVGGEGLGGGVGIPKEKLLFFRPLQPPSGRWVCLYRVCLMLLCIISVTLDS